MIRVLIVDDEPLARDNIRALLEVHDDVGRIDECGGGGEAIRRIVEDEPDLVFLDVQMPRVDGLRVIEEVGPERMPVVVFVTAHDEYALRAFDAAAIDYLLKPFNDARFDRALERARRVLGARADRRVVARLRTLLDAAGEAPREKRDEGAGNDERHEADEAGARDGADGGDDPAADPDRLGRIAVPAGEATVLIDPAEIDWIEAADYYARLHVGDRAYLLRRSLTELERRLDGDRFVRIHRSAIVQVDRIHALRPTGRGGYEVVLRDRTRLRLSRRRRAALERVIGRIG